MRLLRCDDEEFEKRHVPLREKRSWAKTNPVDSGFSVFSPLDVKLTTAQIWSRAEDNLSMLIG